MDSARWDQLKHWDYVKDDIMTTDELRSRFQPQATQAFTTSDANKAGSVNLEDQATERGIDISSLTISPIESDSAYETTDVQVHSDDDEEELEEQPGPPMSRLDSLLKSLDIQTKDGHPQTEVHLVVPKFNQYGMESVLTLIDHHSGRGMMSFELHSRPAYESPSGWSRVSQTFFTALPGEDVGKRSDGNWHAGKPETFPVNPSDRPARHLTNLVKHYTSNRTVLEPQSTIFDISAGRKTPDLVLSFVARDMLRALNEEVKAQEREPSWYNWPVEFDRAPTTTDHSPFRADAGEEDE